MRANCPVGAKASVDLPLTPVNPLSHAGWDDALVDMPCSGFFLTSAWARVLAETYRYVPRYFVSTDQGRLVTLLPLMEIRSVFTGCRAVSLPFSDCCCPLMAAGNRLEDTLNEVVDHGCKAGWRYIELRALPNAPDAWPVFKEYFGHVLPLGPNPDDLMGNLKRMRRQNIRTAIEHDVRVELANTLDGMRTFYRLHCQTRRRHGIPPQPLAFFDNLCGHLVAKGLADVWLARHEGRPVAGAVCLTCGGRVMMKYDASDWAVRCLDANPLLLWRAIEHYCRRGFTHFCFGRTDQDNEGLRRFKSRWGTEEEVIRYYRYDLRRDRFVTAENSSHPVAMTFLRYAPLPLLRAIGRVCYRHVG